MLQDEFIARVNTSCSAFLAERRGEVEEVSEDAAPLVTGLMELTGGGKKLRPRLAWIGWRGAGGSASGGGPPEQLGVALELFQAAALVHDDVIDRSDTRRGRPSVHRRFEQLHADSGYAGSAARFGVTGAILSGDLALAWAGEAFAEAEAQASGRGTPPAELQAARRIFQTMHTQVITGQYLDVLAEVREPAAEEGTALDRARRVLRYKSARYSTEYPMVLGCALAGGGASLREAFAAAALPVGEAFQLRDDLLGVFGDPAATGKPVGDDLREGKQTELIAYGLFRAPQAQARLLATMLGDPDLGEDDVGRAQQILTDCGAAAEVERSIEALAARSREQTSHLAELGVGEDVLSEFAEVRQKLVTRTS